MAVRVTTGRITIAATLAVVMGVASYGVENWGRQRASTYVPCYYCDSHTCVSGTVHISTHAGESNHPNSCAGITSGLLVNEPGNVWRGPYWESFMISPTQNCASYCAGTITETSSSPPASSSDSSSSSSSSSVAGTMFRRPNSASSSQPSSPPSSSSVPASSSSSETVYYCYSCEDGCNDAEVQSDACIEDQGWYGYEIDDEGSLCASHCGGSSSSVPAPSSSPDTSSESDESSSSSAGCGDGDVDVGPDGIEDTPDDVEECDDENENDNDACTNECTDAECGDGATWETGPNGVNEPPGTPGSDDEECDDGLGINTNDNGDELATFCKLNCKRPACSNDYDELDAVPPIPNNPPPGWVAGSEVVSDTLKDGDDGGCRLERCNMNSAYTPGRDSEDNICVFDGPGDGMTPLDGDCDNNGDCAGYSTGQGNAVFCARLSGSQGRCMNAAAPANVMVAQALGGPNFQFPVCPPIPGCGMLVGDENACAAVGGLDGDTCASQDARRVCLQQTAQQQCVDGVVVPVPFGAEWRCTQGNGQPDMCGPAGQWFCKCPNDPMPPLWVDNRQQCPNNCGNGRPEAGEECDDGNKVNGDACSNTCKNNGGQCPLNVDDCANGGDAFCAALDKVCQRDVQLPCIKCVQPVGGQCDGWECRDGGRDVCAAHGKECSLMNQLPCIECIEPNSCGNGKIDLLEPTVVDDGCRVAGIASELCVDEGQGVDLPREYTYDASFACFNGAHCMNVGHGCVWEPTPTLQECLEESGGTRPLAVHDAEALMAQLTAQIPGVPLSAPEQCNSIPCCNMNFSFEPITYSRCVAAVRAREAQEEPKPPRGQPLQCYDDIDNDGDGLIDFQDPGCKASIYESTVPKPKGSSPTPECEVGGCYGNLCVPRGTDTNSHCPIVQQNACYATATCAWNGMGCAWSETPELTECLTDNAAGSCPSDQSCMENDACAETGGSAGNACGTDNTNVCCTMVDQPIEECDDGNRIEGDACGTDCKVNCKKHADCPEGACVNGECVDQCVAPVAGGPDDDPPAEPAGFTYCDVTGTPICPAGADACRDGQCYSTGFGMFVDGGVACSCGDLPMLQGNLPSNFLLRMLAQQVATRFNLLP